MKKILILLGLIALSSSIFAQAQEQYTYTPEYIRHLKNCMAYSDEYQTSIPTGDENSPYLKVKSTEEILGYMNGKCYTRSTIYSYDLDKTILKIKCGLTRAQVADATKKMMKVNMESSPQARKELQKDLTNLIENKDSCNIKNYLDE